MKLKSFSFIACGHLLKMSHPQKSHGHWDRKTSLCMAWWHSGEHSFPRKKREWINWGWDKWRSETHFLEPPLTGAYISKYLSLVSHHTCRNRFSVRARGQVLTSSLPQLGPEQLWFVTPFTGLSLHQPHTSLLCAHLAARMVSSSNSQGHLKRHFLPRMSHPPILS